MSSVFIVVGAKRRAAGSGASGAWATLSRIVIVHGKLSPQPGSYVSGFDQGQATAIRLLSSLRRRSQSLSSPPSRTVPSARPDAPSRQGWHSTALPPPTPGQG